jgi:predicted HTH transcriptional regulator
VSLRVDNRVESGEARAVKVDREKIVIADLQELAVNILDYARDQGRVTMRDMVRTTGASSNTLKDHFRRLVEKKLLVRHGAGRSTWYGLP